MVLAGKWGKLAYRQIHDDSRTRAQSAKALKKGFRGFCYNSVRDLIFASFVFFDVKRINVRGSQEKWKNVWLYGRIDVSLTKNSIRRHGKKIS